jgi:hypothetical protein
MVLGLSAFDGLRALAIEGLPALSSTGKNNNDRANPLWGVSKGLRQWTSRKKLST